MKAIFNGSVLAESDDRRGGANAFGIRDHLWLSRLHYCHARVTRAKIYTNYFTHALMNATIAPLGINYASDYIATR